MDGTLYGFLFPFSSECLLASSEIGNWDWFARVSIGSGSMYDQGHFMLFGPVVFERARHGGCFASVLCSLSCSRSKVLGHLSLLVHLALSLLHQAVLRVVKKLVHPGVVRWAHSWHFLSSVEDSLASHLSPVLSALVRDARRVSFTPR